MNELLQEKRSEGAFSLERREESAEETEALLEKRLKEQTSEHNGGSYWVGTMGLSSFGNTGASVGGIRVGGKSGHQSAFAVMGERKYKDFRDDRIIDNRQFQQALRRLRQYSSRQDLPRTDLDVEGTIDKTCQNGGFLQVAMEKPRKNAIKLLRRYDAALFAADE